ncbi:hypothetical protein ACRRTK_001958 [Alexandromys fortis]
MAKAKAEPWLQRLRGWVWPSIAAQDQRTGTESGPASPGRLMAKGTAKVLQAQIERIRDCPKAYPTPEPPPSTSD